MKLWILSDWHTETRPVFDPPRPDFDVLVVAGDVSNDIEEAIAAVRAVADEKAAIFVAGNHEYWGGFGRDAIRKTLERGHAAAERTGVWFLECDSAEIGGVRFAGATLWTGDDARFVPSVAYLARSRCDVAITHFEPTPAIIKLVGPQLWIYGHHHGHGDRLVGRTRIVRNGGRPDGGQVPDDPMIEDFVVEIEAG